MSCVKFCDAESMQTLADSLAAMESARVQACSLFEWVDGPLVAAMRHGDIILIDELNLAEDAVLERLNRCTTRMIWPLPPRPGFSTQAYARTFPSWASCN